MSTSSINDSRSSRSSRDCAEGQAKRACLSCRRQRRWCDKTLPNCLICTKAHRQCDGYVPDMVRTFVNLDASNVLRRNKKNILCEALAKSKFSGNSEVRRLHPDLPVNQVSSSASFGVPIPGKLNIVSIQTDFRQHVESLWQTFVSSYCQTKDYWPPGCTVLIHRNKALDLSLIALSARRLSLSSPDSDLRMLSLTAYNKSLGLYRHMLQNENCHRLTAMLAVTSTVYALIEASLMQPEDIASFGWGKSGHFDGALALMRKTGPQFYSTPGFHLVFKKIREMGLFLSVSRHEDTFLLGDEWMSIPWKSQPKTWRDRLYDLAMGFTEVIASSQALDLASSPRAAIGIRIEKALRIEEDIKIWHLLWLFNEFPHLKFKCDCQSPDRLSCIFCAPVSEFPSNDFALLQVECWALQLLISVTLSKLFVTEADFTPPWVAHLPERSSQIAGHMEAAYAYETFKPGVERSSGITEGFCRTIFPTWALKEYRRFENRSELLPLDSEALSDLMRLAQ